MRLIILLAIILTAAVATAQEGPADGLWELYKEGRFEDVVREGKVELTTGTSTAQVNLAVGRSLVDLGKNEEGIVYLETAARMDREKTWVYAWAKVYLGAVYYELNRVEEAQAAWILARDCAATRNATRNAVNNLNFLGLAERFDSWTTFTSEHFAFHYSPNLVNFDGAAYARSHEAAYDVISAWFGGGPEDPIKFFVWASKEEADEAGMPPLGFARPDFNLVHATYDQTVGHEMTHVISVHALEPEVGVGLINEGTAVYHDQTGRDQMARARKTLADQVEPVVQVSLAALWEDWSLLPAEVSYPVGGAWVKVLIDQGGKEKFLDFYKDQTLAHARAVYGEDLQSWMEKFDEDLYQ
jgi:tetratricopeptide (TPR) repeat protein